MREEVRSADRMIQMFTEDKSLMGKLQKAVDPLQVLKDAAEKAKAAPAYRDDKVLYRIAVVVLGSLALLAALGSIALVALGKTTPEVLVALGSAAVGALVGLFAPSPTGK